MKLLRTLRNPYNRRASNALRAGFGIAGVGLALSEIYERPSIALGAIALGLTVGLLHWPWGEVGS